MIAATWGCATAWAANSSWADQAGRSLCWFARLNAARA